MTGNGGHADPNRPLMRDVVEEATFRRQAEALFPDSERFDAIMRGVSWSLAREPEMYPQADPGSALRVFKSWAADEAPAMRILFVFDERQVRLVWIERIP